MRIRFWRPKVASTMATGAQNERMLIIIVVGILIPITAGSQLPPGHPLLPYLGIGPLGVVIVAFVVSNLYRRLYVARFANEAILVPIIEKFPPNNSIRVNVPIARHWLAHEFNNGRKVWGIEYDRYLGDEKAKPDPIEPHKQCFVVAPLVVDKDTDEPIPADFKALYEPEPEESFELDEEPVKAAASDARHILLSDLHLIGETAWREYTPIFYYLAGPFLDQIFWNRHELISLTPDEIMKLPSVVVETRDKRQQRTIERLEQEVDVHRKINRTVEKAAEQFDSELTQEERNQLYASTLRRIISSRRFKWFAYLLIAVVSIYIVGIMLGQWPAPEFGQTRVVAQEVCGSGTHLGFRYGNGTTVWWRDSPNDFWFQAQNSVVQCLNPSVPGPTNNQTGV